VTADVQMIYAIGHSDHSLEQFLALLQSHGVEVLVDVRSQPYSRWTPQFNHDSLKLAVERAGLVYVYLGDALGGRPSDPALYDGEHPAYERMAATPAFQVGLARLQELARERVAAIMCSEGDYTHCHRALLIAPPLQAAGWKVLHIQPNGEAVEDVPKPKQMTLFQ